MLLGMKNNMNSCLFCGATGPFTKAEHVIPEALGNDNLILRNEVCDGCNQFFGSKVESFVLAKTPIAFWRTFLGIRKKRGALPHVDLSQPKEEKGILPSGHELHDNFIGFTCHDDYSVSVDIDDAEIIRGILAGSRTRFSFVFTPLVLSLMGRFFCKIGVELLCLNNRRRARSPAFDQARRYARFGNGVELWPIFHGKRGTLQNLKRRSLDADGVLEEVLCYQYQVVEVASLYTLLVLNVGTDTWVVTLNDPYPTPIIREAVPDTRLQLIWYSKKGIE